MKLTKQYINLYRELLSKSYTLPGFLPSGDGLIHGLWEDITIFNTENYNIICTFLLETFTSSICDRAMLIDLNLKRAGLTEGAVYPEEFTPEMMEIKKKNRNKWKNDILRSYQLDKDKKHYSSIIFSGENPRKMCPLLEPERNIYKVGLHIEKTKMKNCKFENFLSFILNEEKLSLIILNKYAPEIKELTMKYSKFNLNNKSLFLVLKTHGNYYKQKYKFLNPYEFIFSDKECLKILEKLQKTTNVLSNCLFVPKKEKENIKLTNPPNNEKE